MNKQKMIGMITTCIGACLTGIAVYASNYIKGIKGHISGISSNTPKNPISGFLAGEMHKKASAYDYLVTGSFWTGILIFLTGLLIFYRFKKRSK